MASNPLPVYPVIGWQARGDLGAAFFPRRRRWSGAERKRDAS
ncbi:hypothetical protein [Halocatena pleomorpha]|nr:hypothetical protein [Halocatena pleomorpha]